MVTGLLLYAAAACAALEQQGREAMSARQFQVAAAKFQEAVTACPAEPALRVELASAYFMRLRLKEALAEADQVLAANPADAAALKIKGNSTYLLGDSAKAIDTFIRLLDRHPNDKDGPYMLGRIYYQEGQVDYAIGQFERSLRVAPDSYKALDNLGLCYAAKGDNEKATHYYLSAIRLVEKDHPEYEWPYVNLADLLLKQGNSRQSFDAASLAVKRNPVSPRGFYAGAKALEQLEKFTESLNWAQRAASLDPNYADAWYLIARLHRKLGDNEKAEEARQRFVTAKAKQHQRR